MKKFKAGDKVWFEGQVYTLREEDDCVEICEGGSNILFNKYGKYFDHSPKPSLKHFKGKKK